MFREIEIKKFRGVEELKLGNLQRINLFVGKNNSGKSTVLDAIFLLTGPTNPRLSLNINLMRNYIAVDKEALLLNFYNLKPDSSIEINSDERELLITFLEEKEPADTKTTENVKVLSNIEEKRYGLQLDYKNKEKGEANVGYKSILYFHKANDVAKEESVPAKDKNGVIVEAITPKRYDEGIISKYITIGGALEIPTNILAQVVERKEESKIVSILSKIDPKIRDIRLVGDKVMVDVGMERLMPINLMGDGIRKLLTILLSMYEVKGGVLLIDEIDNGLHYSSIRTLWMAVLEAARQMDVQIFATTHNVDLLRGLRAILNEKEFEWGRKEVVTYSLNRLKDDVIKGYEYDFEKLDYCIKQEIEIR